MLRAMVVLWTGLLWLAAAHALFQNTHERMEYRLPKAVSTTEANLTLGSVTQDSIVVYYDLDEDIIITYSFVWYEFGPDSDNILCPPSTSERSERKTYSCTIDGLTPCTVYDLTYYGVPKIDANADAEIYYSELTDVQTTADETIPPGNLTCNNTLPGSLVVEWLDPFQVDCNVEFVVSYEGRALWDDEISVQNNGTTSDDASFTLTNPIPEAEYSFDVTVRFPGDIYGATASTECTSLPLLSTPPQNVNVTPSSYEVAVNWQTPEQLNGVVMSYDVTVSWPNGSVAAKASTDGPKNDAVVRGLSPCSNYQVTVAAVNGAGPGPDSDPEDTVTLSDDDISPTINLICSSDDKVVTVQWNEVLTYCEASTYNLTYSASVLWDDSMNLPEKEAILNGQLAFRVPDDEYIPGTNYYFAVSTETRQGSCDAITDDEKSSAPNLAVQDTGISFLYLTWEAPATANGVIESYELKWTDADAEHKDLIDATNEYNLTVDVFACSVYQVELTAMNGAGLGESDTESTETPQADLSGLACEFASATSVIVSWEAAPPNCGRNGTVVSWRGESLWDEFTIEDSEVVEGVGSCLLTELYPYTDYHICVTLTEDWAEEVCCDNTTNQGQPSDPTIETTSTLSTISVTWRPPETWNGIPSHYEVSCPDALVTETVDLNTTEYTFYELTEGTAYLVSVKACNEELCSTASKEKVTTDSSKPSNNTGVIVGATLGSIAFVIVVAWIVFFVVRARKRNQLEERKRVVEGNDFRTDGSPLSELPAKFGAYSSSSVSSEDTVSRF